MVLTPVVFDFQHRFLTNVETTDVNIINVNIGFQKTNVNIHYTTSAFYKNRCRIVRNIQKSKNYKK